MPSAPKSALNRSSGKRSLRKTGSQKKELKIKYTDKSGGQPGLVPIFEEIKKMLTPYDKGTMKLLGGTGGKVILISTKPVEIFGRKREELWFASALVQKGYVGFYYMPVYGDNEVRKMIKPELLNCLKGKACFHIKKYDKEIFSQVSDALKAGYDCWHKRGWI